MAPQTRIIYRSLSAKIMIFIQVCREMWEFAGDGERYYEKIVHSFLPALFERWRELNTSHVVTIVLISRVFYDQSQLDYAAGPVQKDEDGRSYKDFFKVITDLEVILDHDWRRTLVSLKDSFWAFQRDILLTHHYHQANLKTQTGKADSETAGGLSQVQLVGEISFAHNGPILEALNLALNATETHYIDRSLTLTGTTAIIITPGTGHFRVNKQLLRLTTSRILDQGFGLDLVCLTKSPLHRSPIFSFRGVDPDVKNEAKAGSLFAGDPLWGGDESPQVSSNEKTIFYWEPFWLSTTFWDHQMDLPIRNNRSVLPCKRCLSDHQTHSVEQIHREKQDA